MKKIIELTLHDKNDNKIISLLKNKQIKKLFCYHDWVYWKPYGSKRTHRVCRKCYKKQSKIYNALSTFWTKEYIKF